MSAAHALVGQLALVLGGIAAIWAIGLVVLRRDPGAFFVGNLVWLVGAVAVAALLGVVTAITAAPPHDPLHVVYGVLAVGVMPATVLVAAGRPARQRSIAMAAGTTVLAIILLRLLQTGG